MGNTSFLFADIDTCDPPLGECFVDTVPYRWHLCTCSLVNDLLEQDLHLFANDRYGSHPSPRFLGTDLYDPHHHRSRFELCVNTFMLLGRRKRVLARRWQEVTCLRKIKLF